MSRNTKHASSCTRFQQKFGMGIRYSVGYVDGINLVVLTAPHVAVGGQNLLTCSLARDLVDLGRSIDGRNALVKVDTHSDEIQAIATVRSRSPWDGGNHGEKQTCFSRRVRSPPHGSAVCCCCATKCRIDVFAILWVVTMNQESLSRRQGQRWWRHGWLRCAEYIESMYFQFNVIEIIV